MGHIFQKLLVQEHYTHTHTQHKTTTQKMFLERPLIEAGTVTIWKGQRSCNGTSGHSYDIWEGRQSVQIHTHVRYAQVLTQSSAASGFVCICV